MLLPPPSPRAEGLLEVAHDDRAMRAADDALRHYREESRLQGFEGKAVRHEPEAWMLLRRTIRDAEKDRSEERKVESSLADVVTLRASEMSAKHKYEEEKQQLKHDAGPGEVGQLMDVTDRAGGLRAEESGIEHVQRHLERKERTWVKADSLEAANLAAAKELKMERDLEDALSPSPPPPPQASAASKGKTAHVEGGDKAEKEVPFIPKHYLDVPKVPKVHPRRPGAARKAQVKQQQLVSVHKQQGQRQQQQQGHGHQLLPGVKPDGELEGKINLEGVAVPQAANVAMFRQSQRVNRRQEIQTDGGY